MAKKKEVPEMSELQLEQRRQAAAKPHPDGCACMQCFYRARKVAREGGEQTFPTRVDWKAAMDLERAARARLGETQDAVDQEDQAVDDLVSDKVNRAGASSTNTVSQDKEVQLQGDQAPDIVTFTTSPDYLGLEPSPPQRALLKASYGIKLEPDELECFQTCTGRQLDPQINFGTVVVIVGARGGKDSRFVGPSALYESTFGGHKIAKGEDAVIALYAQDRDAANVTFQYISDYVSESPVLSKRLVGMPLRRSLKLEGGFTIRTFPASRTAGRAYSFPLVCLNESAFFRFEGSANADVEILTRSAGVC